MGKRETFSFEIFEKLISFLHFSLSLYGNLDSNGTVKLFTKSERPMINHFHGNLFPIYFTSMHFYRLSCSNIPRHLIIELINSILNDLHRRYKRESMRHDASKKMSSIEM